MAKEDKTEKKDEKEDGKIDFKYNLRLYFRFLMKYKLIFVSLLVIILILESSYILERYLFKVIVDNGTAFADKTSTAQVFVQAVAIVALVYIIVSVGRVIFKAVHIHLINRLDAGIIVDMKRGFFNHLLNLDYNFHTTHRTGGLISKLVRIGGAVERLTDVFIFNFAPLILQLAVAFFSLIYFSWIPAVITLATIIVFIAYSFFMQKIQEKANIDANNAEDTEKANISDIFTNIESIKCFGKADFIENRYKNLSENTKKKTLRFWDYFRWFDSIQSFILATGTFLLVFFTIQGFLNGQYGLGTLVFIYTVFITLFGNMFGFVWGIRNFYRSMADFEVLFRYSRLTNEIEDKPDAKELRIKEGEIEFKDVTFKYGKRIILKDFDLKIPRHKKIAIVGHSGSGKTTLVKLLYRLYDVDEGKILIDGQDIKEFKQESLRGEMSLVPQECVLFNDTIYNNIAFSNQKATREHVLAAIKFAQLDKIIKDFPNRENTIVGERGVKLSGGEKQRVSIARAILANKKILVLDEATSSLDSETEHEIRKDLEVLMQGRTTIIIAHRLSTIMNADKIIVMEKGRIVQQGSHFELIKRAGPYKNLWSLQKGGYIK